MAKLASFISQTVVATRGDLCLWDYVIETDDGRRRKIRMWRGMTQQSPDGIELAPYLAEGHSHAGEKAVVENWLRQHSIGRMAVRMARSLPHEKGAQS